MATKLDKVDVVTIGVGWTGGIVAAELTKAGYKVVGLERGGYKETEDFVNKHDELKFVHREEMMLDLSDDTVTFRNNLDETATPRRENLSLGTSVGGAGFHWSAQTHRYFPYDFKIREETIERYGEEKIPDGMTLQDWGITYDELEPYYDKFEKIMGISGEEDPLAGERTNPYPTPPLHKTKGMRLFEEAARNLGYHPYAMPSGTVSEEYENPDGQTLNACQYNGFCTSYACEWGAKASPIITVIPTAQATGNFELRTNSRVTRVLYEGDRATGVLYVDTRTGEEFEQPAEIVAMTSQTFTNTRLLLLSEIGTPYNPKTGEGIIGKNFTDHNVYGLQVQGFFNDQKFNTYIGSGAQGLTFSDFNADNFDHTDYDFIHGGQIEFRHEARAPIGNNPVPQGTPSWGKEFKEKSLFYYHRALSLTTVFAIMPWRNHYLDLDPNYTDAAGDPLIRATFDYTDQDRNLRNVLQEVAEEVLAEMGADIIEIVDMPEHYSPHGATHNGGGVIMGDSPDTSAVNNYLQMWEMDNLFVFGASAFPQFGSTNPTLTLGALAYRATEGMIDYLENGGGQLVETKKNTQKA